MSLHQDPTQTAVRRQKRSLWTDAWRRMRRSHTAVIGMILFALIVIVCFSAPLFSDYDAQVINSDLALIRKYPVEGHPLGTDELGRDLLLRILWGGRTSITIALAATVVSSVLGIILGAIPAYYGGATDSIIMRTLDVFMAIPSMLLMITLVNIMKPTTFNLIIAMSISGVPSIARIVRGQMLSVMRNEYVEAVRHGRVWRAHRGQACAAQRYQSADRADRILCGGRDHHDFHAFLHWAWRTAARAGMGFHAGGRTAVYP